MPVNTPGLLYYRLYNGYASILCYLTDCAKMFCQDPGLTQNWTWFVLVGLQPTKTRAELAVRVRLVDGLDIWKQYLKHSKQIFETNILRVSPVKTWPTATLIEIGNLFTCTHRAIFINCKLPVLRVALSFFILKLNDNVFPTGVKMQKW